MSKPAQFLTKDEFVRLYRLQISRVESAVADEKRLGQLLPDVTAEVDLARKLLTVISGL